MGVVRLRRDGVRDVKGDILNSAKQLFLDEGYERVSVDMILHDAGASKGSFYHYFNSKEDLIDVLIKKMLDPVYARISGIVSSSMDAVAKLNESFSIAYHWRSDNAKLLNFLLLSFWNESNLVLRNKMRKWCMERDRALLVQIIDQGIDEGVFFRPRFRGRCGVDSLYGGWSLGVRSGAFLFRGEFLRFFIESGEKGGVV